VVVAALGAVANAVVDGRGSGAQPSGQVLADASGAVFTAVAAVAVLTVAAIAAMPGRSAETTRPGLERS